MNKKRKNVKDYIMKIKLLTIGLLCSAIICTLSVKTDRQNANQNKADYHKYVLKSYRNTVALYDGDFLVETYDNIVLDTLPVGDRKTFGEGITVSDKKEALSIIENFDG